MPHNFCSIAIDSHTTKKKGWRAGGLNSFTKVFLPILSIILLFCGFYWNLWTVADQKWFINHQRDSESWVMGRLVKSRQDGIFSAGGLLGHGSPNKNPISWSNVTFDNQYSAYLNGLTFVSYAPYLSQVGAQGIFFSLLDSLIPASPRAKLQIFYMLSSLLSALVLTMIVLWFSFEFGWFVGIFVLCSIILSQWLVVFGRNLAWSIWAFYLPMVVVMYYLRQFRIVTSRQIGVLGTFVFFVVLLKCLNGYDYITTTLIMMLVPLIYYSIRDRYNILWILKVTFITVLGSSLAIFLSLAILICQIVTLHENGTIRENSWKAVDHIIYTLKRRTHPDALGFSPIDKNLEATSLEARIFPVIWAYLYGKKGSDGLSTGTFFNIKNYGIRYLYLLVIFLISSFILYYFKCNLNHGRQRDGTLALICATWFSILAPLSWIIVFKQHSYIHFHMNYIVWHMPFTFFGFAMCGLATKNICKIIGNKFG